MDGVRLNQPFGDVVSWDLIPRVGDRLDDADAGLESAVRAQHARRRARRSRPRTAAATPGTSVQAIYGSDVRRAVEFEHGGTATDGLNWYRRRQSVRRGRLARRLAVRRRARSSASSAGSGAKTDLALTVGYAEQRAHRQRPAGAALPRPRLRERLHQAGHHRQPRDVPEPSRTRHAASATLTLSGNAYYRDIRDRDVQRRHQRRLARSGGLSAERRRAGGAGRGRLHRLSGQRRDARPTRRFRLWRCIGNVLLSDEPAEKCNGLINRRDTEQHNSARPASSTRRDGSPGGGNQFTVGGALRSAAASASCSRRELGYLNPDRSVTGVGAFGDGVTGGDVDGEPFDTRVDLDGRDPHGQRLRDRHAVRSAHVWHLTLSGRYNRTTIRQPRPHQAGRRARLARRRSRLQPVQSGGRRDVQSARAARQRLCRLQRRQPRADVDRAGLRRSRSSRASCRTRWPAIRRSIRS